MRAIFNQRVRPPGMRWPTTGSSRVEIDPVTGNTIFQNRRIAIYVTKSKRFQYDLPLVENKKSSHSL